MAEVNVSGEFAGRYTSQVTITSAIGGELNVMSKYAESA